MTQEECFRRDLDSFNNTLKSLDAVQVTDDGHQYVDTEKVPAAFMGAYRRLLSLGYANGYL